MKNNTILKCKSEILFGAGICNIVPGDMCMITNSRKDGNGDIYYDIINDKIPTYFNIYDYHLSTFFYTEIEIRRQKTKTIL